MPLKCQIPTTIIHRHEKLRNRVNLYRMKEQREISPSTFAHLTSSTLYERRCALAAVLSPPIVADWLNTDSGPTTWNQSLQVRYISTRTANIAYGGKPPSRRPRKRWDSVYCCHRCDRLHQLRQGKYIVPLSASRLYQCKPFVF